MPGKRDEEGGAGKRSEAPRTDLPPRRDPYYEGYFGTDEEEGVVRETEAGEGAEGAEGEPERPQDDASGDRDA